MKINEVKLKMYRQRLGPMSSEEALEMAISIEQTLRDIGPFDFAAEHFTQQKLDYEKYALLLEQAGL